MQRFITHILASCLIVLGMLECQAQTLTNALFRDHGLPGGSRLDVLPQGAIVHLQVGNLFKTLTRLEQFATNAVPGKVLPPEMQPLLQTEHPLLTLLGMQVIQAPLSQENISQHLGIDSQKPITVSLYAGDPRKTFIITVPIANAKVLEDAVQSILNPATLEEISLSNKPAIHLELAMAGGTMDLYVVCSANEAYICGERSLAIALHDTPANQRLRQDAFMRQIDERIKEPDLSLIFNPSSVKPLLLQAQQLGTMVIPLIHMQRDNLLKNIPPEVRARVETQLQKQLGVQDINEFADYAECVVIASYQCLSDWNAKSMISFEGSCLTLNLDPAFPQATSLVYSQDYKTEDATKSIPLADVRKAMAWLGKDQNSFTVIGRKPEIKTSAGLASWLAQMKSAMASKGLKTGLLEKIQNWVQNEPINQPIETKVPWTLKSYVALNAAPAIQTYKSLDQYREALSSGGWKAGRQTIHVIPGNDFSVLEGVLKGDMQTANDRELLSRNFWNDVKKQNSWLDHSNRFVASDLNNGIKQYVQESTYTTHGGIFGFDEHELINRRIYVVRAAHGYLVYHQGARNATWLASLDAQKDSTLSPAFEKLLDRLPEDVNYFHVHRVLSQLPGVVEWVSNLESLAHADVQAYLNSAEKIQKSAASADEAQKALYALKMPELVYSLNRDSTSSNLYCLLPGGIVFPRQKVTPILQNLTAEFSAKADQLGGGIMYTRVKQGSYECSMIQSTEAIIYFISTVANNLMDRYLGSPEKQMALHRSIMSEGDTNPDRYDEIMIANPTWSFINAPKKHQEVKAAKGIPKRGTNTPPELINLSKFYNANLKQTWHGSSTASNSLAPLPRGLQEFGGVKFDVRGIVQLAGKQLNEQSEVRYPKEIKDIKIGQTAKQIHLLHSTGWSAEEGTSIGSYVVHYANGETREIPIVYGKDVRDWWTHSDEPASDSLNIAWSGKNTASAKSDTLIRLFKTTWKNPLPDVEISGIDYRTAMTSSAPFLIAITLE